MKTNRSPLPKLHRTQFEKLGSEILTLLRATQCSVRPSRIGIVAEHTNPPTRYISVALNIWALRPQCVSEVLLASAAPVPIGLDPLGTHGGLRLLADERVSDAGDSPHSSRELSENPAWRTIML